MRLWLRPSTRLNGCRPAHSGWSNCRDSRALERSVCSVSPSGLWRCRRFRRTVRSTVGRHGGAILTLRLGLRVSAIGLAFGGILAYTTPTVQELSATQAANSETLGPVVLTDAQAWSAQAVVDPLIAQAHAAISDDVMGAIYVDLASQKVHVGVHGASSAVLDRLGQAGGGHFEFFEVPHSTNSIMALAARVSGDIRTWWTEGVMIHRIGPAPRDGMLEVGVSTDVVAAQKALDAAYGTGWINAVPDDTEIHLDTTRSSDSPPWNGGDFIYQRDGGNCTAGVPVHNAAGEYLVVAAHCVLNDNNFRNGYIDDNSGVERGAQTIMGPAIHVDLNAVDYPLDAALISTSSGSSEVDFNCAWDCQGRAIQEGRKANTVGEQACVSGAYEGQRCGIVIKGANQQVCSPIGTTPTTGALFCRGHVSFGWRDDHGLLAGEGDSSAPVYAYDPTNSKVQILGMYDFHDPNQELNCDPSAPNYADIGTGEQLRACGWKAYWIGMFYVLDEKNVSLNTG